MMKTTKWILGILMVAALAFAGCSKSQAPTKPTVDGVAVDMPELQKAFATATPELQASVGKVAFGLRYGDYISALKELDTLASNQSLTEPQKQVVNKVIDQMKQLAAKSPSRPTPQ